MKDIFCYHCLPPKPLKDHKSLNGIVVHERVDCPKDNIYFVNIDKFESPHTNTTSTVEIDTKE